MSRSGGHQAVPLVIMVDYSPTYLSPQSSASQRRCRTVRRSRLGLSLSLKYGGKRIDWVLTTLVDKQREVVLAVLVEEVFADLLRALAGLSVLQKQKRLEL